MNSPSGVMSSIFLGDEVIRHISHTKVLSSRILGFLPYYEKRGGLLYNALFSLNIWTSADVSAAYHNLCS